MGYFAEDADQDDSDTCLARVKSLLQRARAKEASGELLAAEALFEEALLLDPTELRTLDSFGVFLHRKKGELAR